VRTQTVSPSDTWLTTASNGGSFAEADPHPHARPQANSQAAAPARDEARTHTATRTGITLPA
jgi:hypothetical protein